MARLFDDASSQYLSNTNPPISGYPFTMACWFNSNDVSQYDTFMSIGTAGSNLGAYLDLRGAAAGDKISAISGIWQQADTSTGASVNTWHHACGVWASQTSRAVYIDGGSKGTNGGTAQAISTWDSLTIGAGDYSGGVTQYVSGSIAEPAIWNASLTDAEVAILAKGYSPLMVRPGNLVFYPPFIRDNDQDIVGGLSLTPVNGPTISPHPRVLYPVLSFSFISTPLVADEKVIYSKIIRSNQIPIHQLQL